MMADLMALFGGKNTKAKTVCNIFCGKLLPTTSDGSYIRPHLILSCLVSSQIFDG